MTHSIPDSRTNRRHEAHAQAVAALAQCSLMLTMIRHEGFERFHRLPAERQAEYIDYVGALAEQARTALAMADGVVTAAA
jgi:hypothetical protein